MFLNEIRIIDLNRSTWDAEKSKPKKGVYVFTNKVYTDKKMADTTKGLEGYKFKWNENSDKAIKDWQIKYGFELVTPDDPYLPEGLPPDAEGKYVFGDAVLMKIPLRKYAEKQMREVAKSERATKDIVRKFEDSLRGKTVDGKDVEVVNDYIDRWKESLGIE